MAIVVQEFPEVAQTFVSLKLAELVRRGHRVRVYAFGRPADPMWLPSGIGDVIDDIQLRTMKIHGGKIARKLHLLMRIVYLLTNSPRAMWLAWREGLSVSGYR